MKIPNFLKSILIGVPIGITFLDTVGYVARVDGISMQPALNPDNKITDYVFLNRWAVRSFDFKRGDIISLISPKDPEQKIIKRIVGIEGENRNTLVIITFTTLLDKYNNFEKILMFIFLVLMLYKYKRFISFHFLVFL